jgi:hypothetical protein
MTSDFGRFLRQNSCFYKNLTQMCARQESLGAAAWKNLEVLPNFFENFREKGR